MLNEWADEDAGIEAVQRILDTLDDVAALQDTEIDPDVLISMLRDGRLHAMLQVNPFERLFRMYCIEKFSFNSYLIVLVLKLYHLHLDRPVMP